MNELVTYVIGGIAVGSSFALIGSPSGHPELPVAPRPEGTPRGENL